MFKMVAACGVALASVALATPVAAQDECRSETGMVCGFVWNDANNNGIQDLGETGLANKLVTLSDGSDTVEAYTDGSGFFYFFDAYDPNVTTYTLSIETSAIGTTAVASTPNVGSDDTVDSDGMSNGTTSSISFQLTNADYDFGFYIPSALSSSLGTGTPGYWKNHPEAWPDMIEVGGVTYDRDTAIYWLKRVGKDKTTTMFSSLVSAKLNVLMGNVSTCVDATIILADAWMAANGPVGSTVAASSPAWAEGQPLHTTLDDYNNGHLCAPHRN